MSSSDIEVGSLKPLEGSFYLLECVIKMCSIVFQTVTTCSSFVGGYRLEVRRLDGVTTEDHSPHFHSYCAV